MEELKRYLESRKKHAADWVRRIEEKQGPNPGLTHTYYGGWDLGYWKGKLSAAENSLDVIETMEDSQEDIEKYRKEIVRLRGMAHLSCPACHEDCLGWIVDGEPCRKDWKL